jgi:hypothetical protein
MCHWFGTFALATNQSLQNNSPASRPHKQICCIVCSQLHQTQYYCAADFIVQTRDMLDGTHSRMKNIHWSPQSLLLSDFLRTGKRSCPHIGGKFGTMITSYCSHHRRRRENLSNVPACETEAKLQRNPAHSLSECRWESSRNWISLKKQSNRAVAEARLRASSLMTRFRFQRSQIPAL